MQILDAISRPGHFLLESGFHADRWLDLDALFRVPRELDVAVARMAERVAAAEPQAVCGPLVGGAFLAFRVASVLGLEFFYTERRQAGGPTLYAARYALPDALQRHVRGRQVVLVDDAVSAGSASVSSLRSLRAASAIVTTTVCLLQLGSRGAERLAAEEVELVSIERAALQSWRADECPLCASGVPLVRPEDGAEPPIGDSYPRVEAE